MSAEEQKAATQSKLIKFRDRLTATYGEKAKDVYTAKLAEEGISEQHFMSTIVGNPDFAWKSLGLDTKPVETSTVPASTRNSQAVVETRTDSTPSFRPNNQARPGEKYASQREATLKRLQEQGVL